VADLEALEAERNGWTTAAPGTVWIKISGSGPHTIQIY
jgi:hypothetical protein